MGVIYFCFLKQFCCRSDSFIDFGLEDTTIVSRTKRKIYRCLKFILECKFLYLLCRYLTNIPATKLIQSHMTVLLFNNESYRKIKETALAGLKTNSLTFAW